MTQASSDTPIILALYRDPAVLGAVEHPGFAGAPPTVIVELSLSSRLASSSPGGAPLPVGRPIHHARWQAPVVFAPVWRRNVPSLLQMLRGTVPALTGPAVLLCHIDDARPFIEHLAGVLTTRLLWHPADRADNRLAELIGRLRRSPLGPTVSYEALYLSSVGRPATADDWWRAVTCPVLGELANMARRLRVMDAGAPGPLSAGA